MVGGRTALPPLCGLEVFRVVIVRVTDTGIRGGFPGGGVLRRLKLNDPAFRIHFAEPGAGFSVRLGMDTRAEFAPGLVNKDCMIVGHGLSPWQAPCLHDPYIHHPAPDATLTRNFFRRRWEPLCGPYTGDSDLGRGRCRDARMGHCARAGGLCGASPSGLDIGHRTGQGHSTPGCNLSGLYHKTVTQP